MEEIFNKLLQAQITPNGLYVLYCIKNKVKCSDSVNFNIEVLRLKSGNYLTESLELSDNSLKFIDEITFLNVHGTPNKESQSGFCRSDYEAEDEYYKSLDNPK